LHSFFDETSMTDQHSAGARWQCWPWPKCNDLLDGWHHQHETWKDWRSHSLYV